LTTAADLTALGRVEASLALAMSVTAAVTGVLEDLEVNPLVAFSMSPTMTATGTVNAALGISMALAADLLGGAEVIDVGASPFDEMGQITAQIKARQARQRRQLKQLLGIAAAVIDQDR
jgi:hypothetical protein